MRLGWLVALELTVLGGTLSGAAAGGVALIGRARGTGGGAAAGGPATAAARPVTAPDLVAPTPAGIGALRPVPDIAPDRSPGGMFDGASDDLLLAHLRRDRITSIKFNRGGSSISLRLTFADGARAACKPDQTNLQSIPRKEIAAYRINRLLGLSGVPPAAARRITWREIEELMEPESRVFLPRIRAEVVFDDEGAAGASVSYWIPAIRDARLEKEHVADWEPWLRLDEPLPRRRASFARQLSGMLVLDLLTSNYDRFTGTNDYMSPDGRTLYYMDNTIGFNLEPEGHLRPRARFLHAQRFSRELYTRLRALDEAALRAELAREPDPPWPILTDEEIAAVMQRREFAVRRIESLIAVHGASWVLCFP